MDIHELSIAELRQEIVSGRTTVEYVCRYFLDRIEMYGMKDKTNAVYALCPDAMREARELDAHGDRTLPLFGIPYLIKDNTDISGMVTTAGSLALTDNLAEKDADVVAKLRAAGAICLGKTNLSELANFLTWESMPNGYSSAGGQVKNAYDETKDPSGSSSGSAVAASLGLAPFTLGTDTSYSVVGCATMNGIVGFRPAKENISIGGVVPITKYADTVGIFARKMEDVEAVFQVIAEKAPDRIEQKQWKLAVNLSRKNVVSMAQRKQYAALLEQLQAQGTEVFPIRQRNDKSLLRLMQRDFCASMEEYLSTHNSRMKSLHDMVKVYHENPETMMKYGASIIEGACEMDKSPENAAEVDKLLKRQKSVRKRFVEQIKDFDAVLLYAPNMNLHYAGVPSISVPFLFERDGMPRSGVLYGADEGRLLAFARYLQSIVGLMPYPGMTKEQD